MAFYLQEKVKIDIIISDWDNGSGSLLQDEGGKGQYEGSLG